MKRFLLILCMASAAHAQRISDLPPAAGVTGTNVIAIMQQSGTTTVTRKATLAQILGLSSTPGYPVAWGNLEDVPANIVRLGSGTAGADSIPLFPSGTGPASFLTLDPELSASGGTISIASVAWAKLTGVSLAVSRLAASTPAAASLPMYPSGSAPVQYITLDPELDFSGSGTLRIASLDWSKLVGVPGPLSSLGGMVGTSSNYVRFTGTGTLQQRTPVQVRADIGATSLTEIGSDLGDDPAAFFSDWGSGSVAAANNFAEWLQSEDGRWASVYNPYLTGTLSGNLMRSGTTTGGTYTHPTLSGTVGGSFTRSGTTTGGTYVSPTVSGTFTVSGTNPLVLEISTANADVLKLLGPYGGGVGLGRDDGWNVVIAALGTDRNLVLFPSGESSHVEVHRPRLIGATSIEGDTIATGRVTLNAQPTFPATYDALTPANFFPYSFGIAMVNAVDIPPSQGVSQTSGSAIVGGNGYGYVRLDTGTTANSVAAKYFWHHNRNTGNGHQFNNYTGIVLKAGSLGYSTGSRFKVALGKTNTATLDWGTLATDGVAIEWECVSSGWEYKWRLITRLGGVVTTGGWTSVINEGQCQMALFGNAGEITFAHRSKLSTGSWTVGVTTSIAGLSVSNDSGVWIGYSNIDTTWSAAQIDKLFMIYGLNPL